MDMFFAAVEIRENPELKEKPVVVYDSSMIMTASYVARKYGIRSGMPVFIGKKLCPEIVLLKTNYPLYRKVS
jgi:DNA polymerase kappa